MDRLIWTAFSGLEGSMTRQRVIASNMANAQTTGYRADTLRFQPLTLKADGPHGGLEVRAMNAASVKGADMGAGALVATGRPLDVAMTGDLLLAVQARDGTEAYTRRGDLSVSATGLLQNGDGAPVIGENGPISVPPGQTASVAPDGAVLLSDPANPDAPAVRADRLKLASPAGSTIEKGLDGLFRVVGGGVLPADAEGKIVPATLEQSNVNPSDVLTQMIEAQRLFDIRTKLVATARDLDQGGAQLMRMS